MFRVTQCSWKNKSKHQGNERASPSWAMVPPKLVSAFGATLIAQDSIEMKFKQIKVKWEIEFSGLFKYFFFGSLSDYKSILLSWIHKFAVLLISQCSSSPGTKLVFGSCPETCPRRPASCQWRTKRLVHILEGKKQVCFHIFALVCVWFDTQNT